MSRKYRVNQKEKINLVTYTHPKWPISEQYRLIRTNILYSSVDKQIKTIVITSPNQEEGKSTVACNLAIVLAQKEKKVLLIDADLRKPNLHIAFNVSNYRGLTDVLTKNAELEDAIISTHIPNLYILPSGFLPPNPSELLDSNKMEQLIEKLSTMADYVIFDTPPILLITDPQLIAKNCDGVVMVVLSGKTQKAQVTSAKHLLEKTNSKLLGVVLNKVESNTMSYYG